MSKMNGYATSELVKQGLYEANNWNWENNYNKTLTNLKFWLWA